MFIEAHLIEGGKLIFDTSALIYVADIQNEEEEDMPMCEICLNTGSDETALFLVRGTAEELFSGVAGQI